MRFVLALVSLATLAQPLESQSPARGLRDQQIEQEIRDRLVKSVIGQENFKVRVREGVAYWEGSTAVSQRKGAATRMAKSAGARSVVNNIVVSPVNPKASPKSKSPPKARPTAPPAAAPEAPRRVKVQWGPRPPGK
jgi:hypothetical protein